MEEIRILYSRDIYSLVQMANESHVTKDSFITIIKEGELYVLLYFKNIG